MAEGGDVDKLCCEFFEMCVVKTSVGKTLSEAEKKQAKTSAVKKFITEGLGKDTDLINHADASLFPKYMDKTKKVVSEKDFMAKMLPDLAEFKAKKTKGDAGETLQQMKAKIAKKCEEEKAGGGKSKDAEVVKRLTDTKGYTGSHKERFDDSGKGKGIDGRENRHENKGYVGNYKGEGTYDKKK